MHTDKRQKHAGLSRGGVSLKTRHFFGTSFLMLFVFSTVAPMAFAAEKGDPRAGKEKYDLLCAMCHGNTGKGDGPAAVALTPKPRSLADPQYMKGLKDEHLFKVIKDGGTAVGKSSLMPPFGAQLKEEDIRNVVAYLRELAKADK